MARHDSLGRGYRISSSGYRLIWVGFGQPMAHRNGYAYEHRIIMAQSLGRPLTRREVVHHINKKKRDNRLVNLKLCVSRRAHKELHRLMRKAVRHNGRKQHVNL